MNIHPPLMAFVSMSVKPTPTASIKLYIRLLSVLVILSLKLLGISILSDGSKGIFSLCSCPLSFIASNFVKFNRTQIYADNPR